MLARVETAQRVEWYTDSPKGADRERVLALNLDALDPIGFSHPAMQLGLVHHLGRGQVLAVHDSECALAVAVEKRGFPYFRLESLQNDLLPAGLPAVGKLRARETISHFIASLDQPLLLREVPVEGQLFQLLAEEAGHFVKLSQWQRAALRTVGSFENWMAENFDHKRRKELKRLRKRLSEAGALETESLRPGQEFESFLEDFLAVEAKGWKGEAGTAVDQNPPLVSALREGLAAFHSEGQLRFWRMRLNGTPIAALFAVVGQGQATLGKIAYDETWSQFSPGVLMIIDATRDLFLDADIQVADSNAIPGHPMIDRIWRDRLAFADVLVAPRGYSASKFAGVRNIERLRRFVRHKIKSVYYSVKGVRPS